MGNFGPIVSPEWLHEHIGDPDLRVIDFRWYLMGGKGRDAYERGHIPGAVGWNWQTQLQDNIRRDLITSGRLRRLIEDDGLRGAQGHRTPL